MDGLENDVGAWPSRPLSLPGQKFSIAGTVPEIKQMGITQENVSYRWKYLIFTG
ncbi:MAG: hypothetical protein AB1847_23260 [bacterium]